MLRAKSSAGANSPSGLYPTKGSGSNDYVYITTNRANPEHWSRLMKLIGREDLIDDPRFATPGDRVAHEKELDAILGEWTKHHEKREAMEKLIAVGVPAGAVFDTMELQNEPSFVERVKAAYGEELSWEALCERALTDNKGGGFIVQELVETAPEPHVICTAEGQTPVDLYVDFSTYASVGIEPQPPWTGVCALRKCSACMRW